MTKTETNPLEHFLNKRVRIILVYPNVTLSYKGVLLDFCDDLTFLNDDKLGRIIIARKDISQILPDGDQR